MSRMHQSMLLVASVWIAMPASADIRLPRIFTDNMMFQRDQPVRVWGWADPNEAVSVDLSGKSASTNADAAGRWAVGQPVPGDLYRPSDERGSPVGLSVNGEKTEVTPNSDGYVHLQRSWKPGDVVELNLPMPIRRVHANEKIEDNRGKVALMRGPLVYCVEAADQPDVNLTRLRLPRGVEMSATHRNDLLGGVTVLEAQALADGKNPTQMTAIPYYAWQNRTKGAMTVWIQEAAAP